jgi:hypothetical protein
MPPARKGQLAAEELAVVIVANDVLSRNAACRDVVDARRR